ncbi:MAG: PBSX family phage terminase large subunit [Collinsella tanakaei]|nr:MAG: PBSX family phage terminase large subunit [Collinsella tanakaei]
MMRQQVRISDIIIQKYMPIFNNRKIKHIILTSGRAGTKSSFAAIKSDYQLVSDAHGSVVVLRKHHNKLRKTVYKEMLRGINRLGIPKKRFLITKSPMEIIYKKYGTTMYFSGSDGIDDTKGIIDEDKPIKLVVIDEATEFFDDGEGENELANIEATFVRGNKGGFQMIYLYNPPKNPNAPINQWCKKMEQRPDCLHIHTDYRDVPPEWLGPDLIDSARAMEAADPKMYRWIWLGESVGIDDLIYYMYGQKNRYKAPEGQRYRIIGIGVDYGQQNATTYQPFGLNLDKKRLEGLAEYYYSGRDTGKQKSPSEYADDFIKMTDELHEKYKCSIFYAFIDPSAAGLAEEIKRRIISLNYQILIKPAENDVALGIQRVQKCLSYGILTVSPFQEKLDWEFGLYEYDKKSIERGKEVPIKENDHACDAVRYLVMGVWTKIKYFLPKAERGEDT